MDDLISRQGFDKFLEDAEKEAVTNRKYVFASALNAIRGNLRNFPSEKPDPQWIPCSERLPERIINGDVETVQEFFVTVKERWPGEEWKYHIDVAEFPGDYIDDVWQTYNDWKEGQDVHVIAWQPLPEPYMRGEPNE